MVGDIAESLVATASTSVQGGTQQHILPKSQPSSSLNVDETNLLEQSAVNDEQVHKSTYSEFFDAPSQTFPTSPPSNSSPKGRLRHVFSLYLRTNNSMQYIRTTRGVFRRCSTSSQPVNYEPSQPRMKGKSRVVSQDDEHGDIIPSEDVVPGPTERSIDKGKRLQDPIVHRQPSAPGNISSSTELDTKENQALFSLFRSRKNGSNKAPATPTQDSSPEAADVFPCRYPQGFIAHKQRRKKKSAFTRTGAQNISSPAGASSRPGPSTHDDPAHPPTLQQEQAGPSSQPVTGHADQSLQASDDSYTDCDSYSDSSIQGPFLKCLDMLCFPCGHYKE